MIVKMNSVRVIELSLFLSNNLKRSPLSNPFSVMKSVNWELSNWIAEFR